MDPLRSVLKIASSSMQANQLRLQVTAQNAANIKSYDYTPQSIEFQAKKVKEGFSLVEVKKIHKNENLVKKTYDPDHPQANEEGMVTSPDLNPITVLMDLQEVKQSTERDLKVHELATDLHHKIIKNMAS